MIFKDPWYLLLTVFLPLLYRLALRSDGKVLHALERLRGESGCSGSGRRRRVLKIAGLLMLIVALARPVWNPHPVPSGLRGRDLVIALDISRSMLAADLYPSRLEAARFVLLEGLPGFRGQRLGLITFAGSSSVRVPLTLDHNFMRYMLERVRPADADVGSTSLQSAVEKALDIVLEKSERGRQDLIILTDGEDHISDVDKMVEQLREWGARVLIIGLGDPVTGARVPEVGDENTWMRYKEREVVSRLDEATLQKLAAASPGIVYYPARTKPFDLMTVYRNLLAQTSELDRGDETRVVYDEGFPYCIALAIVLLVLSFRSRLKIALFLLFLCGCVPRPEGGSPEYERNMEAGVDAWAAVQPLVEQNPPVALQALVGARESFLLAAMCRPGDLPAARYIAGVSAQIREVEGKVRDLQEEEEELRRMIEEAVGKLHELIVREDVLSQSAQQLLRARPSPPPEEKRELAVSTGAEQTRITAGTGEVLDSVRILQAKIRRMLSDAFGDEEQPATTEYDEAALLLESAVKAQVDISEQLARPEPAWSGAGSSLVIAVREMQRALDLLAGGSGEESDDGDKDQGDKDNQDYEGNTDWGDSNDPAVLSMPIRSQNFSRDLNNRNMPVPNYTAEEILAEEEQNLLKRERRNEERAGAKVEKNW